MKPVEKILITGALGQIGTVLSNALKDHYGNENVLLSDIRSNKGEDVVLLDVTDPIQIDKVIKQHGVTQIYHLAALLSAKGENNPLFTWNLNMTGLINILEAAKNSNIRKLFFPSSIAVYGNQSPKEQTPQLAYFDPSTIYGISKAAGEYWCQYYHEKYKLDIRSLRYPGLISHESKAGGGTTDYAVEIFDHVYSTGSYTCFLKEDTTLPMMYMDDAIRGTIELMDADSEKIKIRSSYNFSGFSFSPGELTKEIQKFVPNFQVTFSPDKRQTIADTWPNSIDDSEASADWGWQPRFSLEDTVSEMLFAKRAQGSDLLSMVP